MQLQTSVPNWVCIRDASTSSAYTGEPAITLLPNRKYFTIWHEGLAATDPSGKIMGAIGNTWKDWGTPYVVHGTANVCDLNPCFLKVGDRIYLFHNHYLAGGAEDLYMLYSDDNALTWSTEVLIIASKGLRANGLKCSNGDLLLPVYAVYDGNYVNSILKCPNGSDPTVPSNWMARENVAVTRHKLCEPTIIETPSPGHILMYMRDDDRGKHIWKAESNDFGETWGRASQVSGVSSPPSPQMLYKSTNGCLILIFNNTSNKSLVRCFNSANADDIGWYDTKVIETRAMGVRYPSCVDNDNEVCYVWQSYLRGYKTPREIHVWGELIPPPSF